MNIFDKAISKYKGLSKPAKASLWFTGCYVIQRGLQFIGMPIYTRMMSQDEYGVYSVFLSWFNLVCVFSSLSIYNGTFNKAMVKYQEERDRYISAIQALTTITSLVFAALIIGFHSQIESYTGYGIRLQLLFCLHLLLFPTLQYWSQKQRFLFEYKKLVLITLLNSIASLVLGIIFVAINTDKSSALIAVTVGVQAAINLVIYIQLALKGKCAYDHEFWKWTIVTSIPLIPHYLSEILLGHADRLMIDQMCGSAQAGIYNIVYQISMVMTIMRQGINGSFTPWLYYSLKEKRFTDIRRVTKLITIFMWALTFFFMLIGPEILHIVAPPSYFEAVDDIPAIMIGCYFIFIYVLFLNVEIYYEQNQFVALASIIAAILNVVLNYICIKEYGYLAAGYTTMVSYMVMAILHYLFLRRIIKSERDIAEVFDFKFILISSVILIAIGVAMITIYKILVLRLLLIIGIIGVSVVKRESIIGLLDELKNRS